MDAHRRRDSGDTSAQARPGSESRRDGDMRHRPTATKADDGYNRDGIQNGDETAWQTVTLIDRAARALWRAELGRISAGTRRPHNHRRPRLRAEAPAVPSAGLLRVISAPPPARGVSGERCGGRCNNVAGSTVGGQRHLRWRVRWAAVGLEARGVLLLPLPSFSALTGVSP